MKRALLLIILLLVSSSGFSQNYQIRLKSFAPDFTGVRARRASRQDNNNKLAALIKVTLPVVDSVHFNRENLVGEPVKIAPGEYYIYLPEESRSVEIIVAGCNKPYNEPFPFSLESGRDYLMELELADIVRLRTLILASGSFNQSQWSAGMMFGWCKNHGGYIRAMTNFNFTHLNPSTTYDIDGNVDGYPAWFTGQSLKSRLSITGGYLGRIYEDNLYVYVGCGYGIRTLAWEMIVDNDKQGNEYVKVAPYSFRGLELETGLVLRLWRGFTLSAGVQTNADRFKYWEANVGVGVMF